MIWKISFGGLNKNVVMNQLFTGYMKEFQEKYPLECKNDKVKFDIDGSTLSITILDDKISSIIKKDLKSFKTRAKLMALRPLGFKSEIKD